MKGPATEIVSTACATELHLLSKEECYNLLINMLVHSAISLSPVEREPVAKFDSHKFTAKAICNDRTLYQSHTFANTTNKNLKTIAKVLRRGGEMGKRTKKVTQAKDTTETTERTKSIHLHKPS